MLLLKRAALRTHTLDHRPRHFYDLGMTESKLRYLCILDFEATCESSASKNSTWDRKKQEIIELPMLVYNIEARKVDATFHEYIKPELQPRLTRFCTDLTGIEQVNQPMSIHVH